jgi:hypothetical protein
LTEAGKREVAPRVLDFETAFRQGQTSGSIPSDAELQAELVRLAALQS